MDRHHGHIALLPMAVLGASLLVSYERAKAESLGFDAKGGLMERAERVVVLCAGLAFSFLLIPLLWLMLGLTGDHRAQRFVKVWRQANAAGHGPRPPTGRSSRAGPAVHGASPGSRGPLAGLAGGQRMGASLGALRRRLPPAAAPPPAGRSAGGPGWPGRGDQGHPRRARRRLGWPAPARHSSGLRRRHEP